MSPDAPPQRYMVALSLSEGETIRRLLHDHRIQPVLKYCGIALRTSEGHLWMCLHAFAFVVGASALRQYVDEWKAADYCNFCDCSRRSVPSILQLRNVLHGCPSKSPCKCTQTVSCKQPSRILRGDLEAAPA